jgi:hypothetical protein
VKRIDTLMMEIDTRFKAVEAEATPAEVGIDDTKGVEEVL